jgi:hypothetical protein
MIVGIFRREDGQGENKHLENNVKNIKCAIFFLTLFFILSSTENPLSHHAFV